MNRMSGLMVLLLGFGVGSPSLAAERDPKAESTATVQKTCECVRRHPSGFPIIEPRLTSCKVTLDGRGQVLTTECVNCYSVCSDKPTS
ncbi:MAG: hypothetical protein ACOZB0_09700 [Pseudomonadota bacterium]